MKPKLVSNNHATSQILVIIEKEKESVILLIRIEKNIILNICFKTGIKIPPTQPCRNILNILDFQKVFYH